MLQRWSLFRRFEQAFSSSASARRSTLPLSRNCAAGRFVSTPLPQTHNSTTPVQADEDDPMPPDYELQSYWNKRFVDEKHFEWLGDGTDTILPPVRSFLVHCRSSSTTPARVLHIGAGTSSLSERIRELYVSVYGEDADQRAITNTDFAENLVTRKLEGEKARCAAGGPEKGMQWICADALKWTELRTLADTKNGLFDLVVDKSTSDAISCGEDVTYTATDSSHHPLFNGHLAAQGKKCITLSPVEVLAIHLSSIVRPGGLWVSLTFSSNRFAFLSSPEGAEASRPHAAQYWAVEDVRTVDAPTGAEGGVHAPVVQHRDLPKTKKWQ